MQSLEMKKLWWAIYHGRVDRRNRWMAIKLNDDEVANLRKVLVTVVGPFRRQADARTFIREEKASDTQRAELVNQLRLQWPKQPSQMTSVLRRLSELQKESEKRRITWKDEITRIRFIEPRFWWCKTLDDAAWATSRPLQFGGAVTEPFNASKFDEALDDCE